MGYLQATEISTNRTGKYPLCLLRYPIVLCYILFRRGLMTNPHNHIEDHQMSPQQQESTEPTKTGAAEQPAAGGQGFTDRVGQKQRPIPDPFGIATDNVAGVRLFESRQDQQMAIKFGDGSPEDKPSQAVIDKMKDAGFK